MKSTRNTKLVIAGINEANMRSGAHWNFWVSVRSMGSLSETLEESNTYRKSHVLDNARQQRIP